MHGVQVTRKPANGAGETGSDTRVRRVSVHYAGGGMMAFVPEAGEEFFSKDDLDRLAGILDKSSSALEWEQPVSEGVPDPEQGKGLA